MQYSTNSNRNIAKCNGAFLTYMIYTGFLLGVIGLPEVRLYLMESEILSILREDADPGAVSLILSGAF